MPRKSMNSRRRTSSHNQSNERPSASSRRKIVNESEAKTSERRGQQAQRAVRVVQGKEGETKDVLRWVALGGLEEIGRNMMFFEYKDEILIIDAGLQFPEEETPGIDYIIPNVTYLEERRQNIKGMIITHGHYDHIGAIPYILDKLGNPLIYTTHLSKEIILKRQEDFPNSPKPQFDIVSGGEKRKFGKYFEVTFFDVIHNIPEGVGMIVHTPIGNVVHPGEFKFDYDDDGKPKGMDTWKWVGEQKVHTLMLDSTGAETPGFSLSERIVERELEKIFRSAEGRILVGTFASLLDRLGEIIKIAEKLNRKVAIGGFSMKNNIQIAQNLGYLKIQKGTIIPIEEVSKLPPERVLVLCTGAQGEPNAALMRISNGEHRHIRLNSKDTIVLSSSIVPGNERSVQNLKDNLARQGATIYHYKMLDIHSSGHAPQEELKKVMELIKPKYFLPIHGYYFMRARNAKLAEEALKIKPGEALIADNGVVVELSKTGAEVTNEHVPAFYVMVDGLGVGDVGEVVLRDRRTLAQEGMIVIILSLSRQSGRLLKNPDIISRGFIYLKENQELLEEVRRKIRGIIGKIPGGQTLDADYVKTLIRDQIGQFLYNKTERRPMILPVVIEI